MSFEPILPPPPRADQYRQCEYCQVHNLVEDPPARLLQCGACGAPLPLKSSQLEIMGMPVRLDATMPTNQIRILPQGTFETCRAIPVSQEWLDDQVVDFWGALRDRIGAEAANALRTPWECLVSLIETTRAVDEELRR